MISHQPHKPHIKKILIGISIFFLILLPFQASWAERTLEYKLHGLDKKLEKNAKSRLEAVQERYPTPLTEENIHKLFKQAPTNIHEALKPFGYFKSVIKPQLGREGEHWVADFYIKPGSPIRITELEFKLVGAGRNDPEFQKLSSDFPLKEGQILVTKDYEKAKESLFELADKRGYMDAQLTRHTIFIDTLSNTAKVELQFETGRRYFFGPVRFAKNPLHDDLLKRYIPFKEGDPYSTHSVLALQNALTSSSYFQNVSIHPKKDKVVNSRIPIDVNLTPRKSQQYSFGVGFGTDTKFRGSLGWEQRRVNAYGHRFHALARASNVQDELIARYTIPGGNPVTDQYNFTAAFFKNNYKRYEGNSAELSFSYITHHEFWQRTFSIKYKRERFRFQDKTTEKSQVVMPILSWLRIKTNDQLRTINGHRFGITLKAGRGISNDIRFIQALMQGKYIKTITPPSRIVLRGELGYTIARDNTALPASDRFYAGGTQSVRGYGYYSLGPGRYLTVGSAEYQHRIVGKLYGAVFYDVGNAVDHISVRLKQSAGVGLVYMSPIGPIEITLAQTINKDSNAKRIEFIMGPDL